ncbi:MAG: NADPH-dependent 7-cyano-7-deazaguanine reductase QueF [Leptospiraceae bacterium]|nr:NADPH-dependent 7-cyano-7-deazaguanine reductase QueF [Leptospiraceae bacterium]
MHNVGTSSYEDRQDHIPDLTLPKIEVFRNVYRDRDYRIDMEIPEFTAICPKTGLPDFGIIYLQYKPVERCLELKSLKEYFTAYRNIGIFHENVVNRAMDDILDACQPRYLRLHADYNVRGGIKTRVTRVFRTTRPG